jgi:hypothetical protein
MYMKPIKLYAGLAAAVLSLTVNSAKAQDKEVGLFLGAAFYQGDLTFKQVTLSETKPGLGILGRYYFNPRFDLKGSLQLGWIEGSDDNYGSLDDPDDNARSRFKRHLSFKSHVLELSLQGELNLLPYISNSKKYRFAPYIFAGIGVFHFNPKAQLDGTSDWVALQPLHTEEPEEYGLIKPSIPYGVGIKYSLGNFWNLGIEVGQRKLFTDYLDDVSNHYAADASKLTPQGIQFSDRTWEVDSKEPTKVGRVTFEGSRGDPKDKDMYVFAGFTITKTIRRFSCTNF